MALSVGTLYAKLELLTDAFDKSLDDAGRRAWNTGKKLSAALTVPLVAAGRALYGAVGGSDWADRAGDRSDCAGCRSYDATVRRLTMLFRWIWEQVQRVGKWFGFGGEGPAAPAPRAASATSAVGASRGYSGERVGGRDAEIVEELKRIGRNTERKAYA